MKRLKINGKCNLWRETLFLDPQVSIIGPLFFNVFICNIFYFLLDFDVGDYADNSTPFNANKNI